MGKISLVVFDLSGTTVTDDNAVAKCMYQGANHFGVNATLEDFEKTIGTNKIHLYEHMIARDHGETVDIAQLEKHRYPQYRDQAMMMFNYYSELMIAYYEQEVIAMPGAEETFVWCKSLGIKVATDTGFHRAVHLSIMKGLLWKERGLVDLALDVDDTNGIGRPSPYLIFKAMTELGIQSVHEVIKIGDTPADLLSGYHAGCIANIGVLSGTNSQKVLFQYPHTHLISSVADLPELITKEFL